MAREDRDSRGSGETFKSCSNAAKGIKGVVSIQPINEAKIPNGLKALPQWVVWKWGPAEPKPNKVPYNPHNPKKKASPTNPKTWATFQEAVETYKTHAFDGVGFVFFKDDTFTGVDLDNCRDAETGELEAWAQQIVGQLNSYGEVSPSGTGVHIFVQASLPPKGRKKGQIEMYDASRFFCMTGNHLPNTPPTIELRSDQLARLHAQVFGKSKMPLSSSNGNHDTTRNCNKKLDDDKLLEKARNAKNGHKFSVLWNGNTSAYQSDSEADLALCGQLAFWTGGDEQRMDRMFRQSGLMRPKWDESHYADGQTYGAGTIAKAVEGCRVKAQTTSSNSKKSRQAKSVLDELNHKHAVVRVGGKTLILNEEYDPVFRHKGITLSSPADLKLYYDNQPIKVKGQLYNPVTLWLKHKDRRQYEGIVMAPGQDPPRHYNLWQGFAVEPQAGDCSLYLDHLKWNIAQGDEEIYKYLIHWMAHTVQHPSNRVGVSIVLRGRQGTGKGVMCSQFGALFGSHFVHVQHSKHLVGHFNAHLKAAVVVFADEAFWAGDKAGEGAIKAMVTEDKLPIEFKGKDVIYVKNHIHLLMASNHEWVIPAGLEERRFFVVDVGEGRMQNHVYFEKITKQMENGGREALLDFLLNVDLEGINLRKFPQTQALLENKIHSMSPVESFWYEILMSGSLREGQDSWQGWEVKDYLHETFVKQAGKTGQRYRSTQTQLGITLKKLMPGLKSCRRTIDGKRVTCLEFPDLALCRRAFDRVTNCEHAWPDESAARVSTSEGKDKT